MFYQYLHFVIPLKYKVICAVVCKRLITAEEFFHEKLKKEHLRTRCRFCRKCLNAYLLYRYSVSNDLRRVAEHYLPRVGYLDRLTDREVTSLYFLTALADIFGGVRGDHEVRAPRIFAFCHHDLYFVAHSFDPCRHSYLSACIGDVGISVVAG